MSAEPHKLTSSDVLAGFNSGAPELDEWLTKYARQNQSANSATTYVVTDGARVIGYYPIAMSAVGVERLPTQLRRSMPKQVPCILLARLAVDQAYNGQGLGAWLLRDALLRSFTLSRSIGAVCFLVHCRDDAARRFYLHTGDFLASPVDDLHLMLPTKGLGARLGLDQPVGPLSE